MKKTNITRADIEELNVVEPYCFDTDNEELWYNVGLTHGLQIADAEPKSPWISVKDDLPCNHEELMSAKCETKKVFILKDVFGNPDIDYMLKENGKWRWFGHNGTKYWMPIPEAPKE